MTTPAAAARTAALYLMAALYAAAGVNHFVHPDFYARIMPPYFPWPLFWVYLSGAAELALAAGLAPRRTRPWAAWGIVAMLIVFMLVHVHMLAHPERFPDVPYWALVARIPLQGVLVAWAWVYTDRSADTPRPT